VDRHWERFIRTGDEHALKVIYNNYFDYLINYGKRFNVDDSLIEDSIQNVFTRLINNPANTRTIKNFSSYLIKSFRNELFHLKRKYDNVDMNDFVENFNIDHEEDAEDQIIKSDDDETRKRILVNSLKKLPASQQEVIYLRYFENLSYEEISEITGVKISSCRTSVYRAIMNLKKDMLPFMGKGILFTSLITLGAALTQV
jgi:RNA polymerase sigma factor (sigma-70 family)